MVDLTESEGKEQVGSVMYIDSDECSDDDDGEHTRSNYMTQPMINPTVIEFRKYLENLLKTGKLGLGKIGQAYDDPGI